MRPAEERHNEADSLEALHALEVLDTVRESEFDALVQAASLACGAPISLISLVDTDRQWFKANVGLWPTKISRRIKHLEVLLDSERHQTWPQSVGRGAC